VLQRYVEEERVAGAVALVLRDGEIVYEGAAGWSDREAERPMATDAVFRIASQSKAITSALMMMLVEEGRINLNEPISRWMPTFANHRVAVRNEAGDVEIVPASRAITVQDLLTHTAGISYGRGILEPTYIAADLGDATAYAWYTADKNETVCETMDRLGTLPQAQHPGAAWVYGYNSDILGCMVERVSGVPLDEFMRTRLTEPLGMVDTHFYLPATTPRERVTTVYTIDSATGRIRRAEDGTRGQGNYIEGPRRNFAGGAGLLSTARDYARFLEMTRNGGILDGARVLSPRSVELMSSNQVGTLHSASGLGFGLGFETVDRLGAGGFASVGSYGWSGAYGTYYKVDPEERLVMVLMLQVVPYVGSGIRESFDAAVYGALVE
jgi:CubicO group peptidase (beta-lactamase class C family)